MGSLAAVQPSDRPHDRQSAWHGCWRSPRQAMPLAAGDALEHREGTRSQHRNIGAQVGAYLQLQAVERVPGRRGRVSSASMMSDVRIPIARFDQSPITDERVVASHLVGRVLRQVGERCRWAQRLASAAAPCFRPSLILISIQDIQPLVTGGKRTNEPPEMALGGLVIHSVPTRCPKANLRERGTEMRPSARG